MTDIKISEEQLEHVIRENTPSSQSELIKKMAAEKQADEILGQAGEDTVKYLLDDDSVPTGFEDYFSVFTDKESCLTNITTPGQMELLMLEFDDAVVKYRLFNPTYMQTAEFEHKVTQLRYKIYIKLLRSTGGTGRERAMIQTHISRDERPLQPLQNGGIMSRIGGWFKK